MAACSPYPPWANALRAGDASLGSSSTGMLAGAFRLLGERGLGETTPWMWATNGFFGVLASVFAVFFAMLWGYTSVLLLAAAAYVVTLLAARSSWTART